MVQHMKQEIRHRVSGNYRGVNAGSWEINGWLNCDAMKSAVARKMSDARNETVCVITESRLPYGRWGARKVKRHAVTT